MGQRNKDYCCCCIPLRFAVGLISLVALVLGAANLISVLKAGSNDDTSKITAYVSTAVYGILGLSGLLSAFIKTYGLAKNFSVLWWSFTIVVTILSVINIVILATKEKDALHTVCQNDLLQTDKYSSGVYDPQQLSDDVESCYKVVLTVAGVSLAIQVLVMSLCGWVASRYTGEVKHMHDGVAYEHSVPAHEQEQRPYKA